MKSTTIRRDFSPEPLAGERGVNLVQTELLKMT